MAEIKSLSQINPYRKSNAVAERVIYCVVVSEPADKVGQFVNTAVWSYRRPLKSGGKINTFFCMASFNSFCKMNKYYIREAA